MSVELATIGQNKTTGLHIQILGVAILHPPVEHGRLVGVAKGGRLILKEIFDFGVKDIPGKRQSGQGHVKIITAFARIGRAQRISGLQEAVEGERVTPIFTPDEKSIVIHIFCGKTLLPRSRRITKINPFLGPFLLFCFQLHHATLKGLHDLVLRGELLA